MELQLRIQICLCGVDQDNFTFTSVFKLLRRACRHSEYVQCRGLLKLLQRCTFRSLILFIEGDRGTEGLYSKQMVLIL